MEKKITDCDLQKLVFKCLTRVLKNRRIYHKFRCFIGYGKKDKNNNDFIRNIYSSLSCMKRYMEIANNSKGDNIFFFTSSKEDIYNILEHINGEEEILKGGESDEKIQMRATHFINSLLHCCVEKSVGDLKTVEEIGKETFEMVCKIIFGENFVDKTEENVPSYVKRLMELQNSFIKDNGVNGSREFPVNKEFLELIYRMRMEQRLRRENEELRMLEEEDGLNF